MRLVVLTVVLLWSASCSQPAPPERVQLGDRSLQVELLLEDDFEDLDGWTIESPCPPSVEEEGLLWPCDYTEGMGTMWSNRRFEGPTLVTYTVTSLAGADNINLIAYADHPEGLLQTTASRTGRYPQYHGFQNYIVTFLTNGEDRFRVRFRKNPGFNLVSETYVDMDTTTGIPHDMAYLFEEDGRMALYVDGRLVHEWTDAADAYRSGYHGLRTWRTRLKYSNFRVYAIR